MPGRVLRALDERPFPRVDRPLFQLGDALAVVLGARVPTDQLHDVGSPRGERFLGPGRGQLLAWAEDNILQSVDGTGETVELVAVLGVLRNADAGSPELAGGAALLVAPADRDGEVELFAYGFDERPWRPLTR